MSIDPLIKILKPEIAFPLKQLTKVTGEVDEE